MISWFRRRPAHLSDEDISAYLDGEVGFAASQRLLAHIRDCDPCGTRLEDLRSVRSLFRDVPSVEAPRPFTLTPFQAGVASRPPRSVQATARPAALTFAPVVALTLLVAVVGADFAGVAEDGSSTARSTETADMLLSRESAKDETANAQAGAAQAQVAPAPAAAPSRSADADAPGAVQTPSVQTFGTTPQPGGAAGALVSPATGPGVPSTVPQAAGPSVPPPATGAGTPIAPPATGPGVTPIDPQATPAVEAFSAGADAQPASSGNPQPAATEGRSKGERVLRVIEALLAVVFIGTVLAFWRPGLFSRGDE